LAAIELGIKLGYAEVVDLLLEKGKFDVNAWILKVKYEL
jgi:hypothetical protein